MDIVKNRVQLTGKIGNLCTFKEFENGRKKGALSLGTTEYYKKNSGENVYKTDWHNLTCWGKVAEEMEKECNPGTKISIDGKLVSRTYIDKEGKKRYVTEVEVKEFEVVEKFEATSHLA